MKDLRYWRSVVGKMDAAALQQLQEQRLKNLLKHSVETIPFYQKRNISLTDNPYETIKQFPVMYKTLMKENLHELLIYDKSKMVSEKAVAHPVFREKYL